MYYEEVQRFSCTFAWWLHGITLWVKTKCVHGDNICSVLVCAVSLSFFTLCVYTMDISIHASVFMQAIAKHST